MKKCDSKDLYKAHKDRLLSLIESKVQDSQKAEDLLHDSFVKLETCCESGCECEYPKAYIFRIAINTVMDFFKKQKKRITMENAVKAAPMESTSSKETRLTCDLYECIYEQLNKMSPENREAYILVDIEQQAQTEVAQKLGLPLSTLKSRVQRTRKALKTAFEECCENPQIDCC